MRRRGEAGRLGELDRVEGLTHDVGGAGRCERSLRVAVLDDVRDLGRGEVAVDGRDVHARLRAGEIELQHRRFVRDHRGDGVPALEPEGAKTVDDAIALPEQAPGGDALSLGRNDRDVRRIVLRDLPEAVVGHRHLLLAPPRAMEGRYAKIERVSTQGPAREERRQDAEDAKKEGGVITPNPLASWRLSPPA